MPRPETEPAPAHGQLLAALPTPGTGEMFDTLLVHPDARIERIVSQGQASPPGFWYDQTEDEWVLLVQGSAELTVIVDEPAAAQALSLQAGDWVFLPAHRRHRVRSTSLDAVWLAIHLGAAAGRRLRENAGSLQSHTGCQTR
jgi:cupin 2 domain-containing protein